MELARYPLLFAGLGFALYGLWEMLRAFRKWRSWQATEGEIVGYVEHPDGGLFAPRIKFTTVDGSTCTFVSETFGSQDFPIGQHLRICYSPSQPEQAEVARFSAWWLFPLIWLGFGIVFLLAGILTPRQENLSRDF